MNNKWLFSPFLVLMLLFSTTVLADEEKNDDKKDKKKKTYESLIDEEVKSDSGLFILHQKEDKFYFEIPDNTLGKDMLMGARVAEISNPSKVVAGEMRKAPVLIRFSRDNKNVYLHQITTDYISYKQESISKSVERNTITPILETFPIEVFNNDSTAAVIEVTDFFTDEIKVVSPFNSKFKAGKLKKEATRITEGLSFPENIQMRTQMSYEASHGRPFLILMHRSILLLPEEPMRPRYEDERIGYFSNSQRLFTTEKIGVETLRYISRFDVNPKPEDIEKYKRGELVEPENPIVYYIDDAFPPEWIPYIKAGVETWQKAFEAIGFKNAIVAKVYPSNDPEFNPEDIRYSCIRYISLPKANAMGPRWIDPRSGQTISGEVLWWHDVTVRLRDWIFVQCAQVEPAARKKNTELELLGKMIKYVTAHEIGHTLGLKHNMRASYAYPVDSLRSATFTQEHGTTPSIMDYARFNYIAQPGDTGVRLLPPDLGVYDYFAIKWGYQPIFEAETPDAEKETLNQWILEKKDNKWYQYGDQQMPICFDPASQNEALGNDAIKASKYGVANLKYIMNHLIEWATFENEHHEFLMHMYEEVLKQHDRYLGHVNSYLGGVYIYKNVEGENEPFYTPVSKQKQKEALQWLMNELSDQPDWYLNPEIEKRLGSQKDNLFKTQAKLLDDLMSGVIFQRLQLYHTDYTPYEYLNDLHGYIWEKTNNKEELTEFDKHLQASYIHNLIKLSDWDENNGGDASLTNESSFSRASSAKVMYIDNLVKPLLLQKVIESRELIKKQLKNKNPQVRAHYNYLYYLINN